MSKPEFKTFWEVSGEQYFNINEVAELVEAGHIAVEVPAEKQAEDWQRQQLLEQWHLRALDRHAKYVAEQQHKESPEGKRELVARHAAEHPGGIVTTTGSNPVFDELDQYGPDKTDVFK